MKHSTEEKGQALILIALAAIGLFAFAALAIDGSRVYSEKRHAQNAADTAAMAGALAHARGNNITTAAENRALSNGYDGSATNDVTVTITDSPAGVCPAHTQGKDIRVDIVSTIGTTFARVLGRQTVTTAVTATSRSCGSYYGPPFNGNAIVTLAPVGRGFDGTGTPDWTITGGGIYSNSTSPDAAYCNGAADISAPSVTVVGDIQFDCHGTTVGTTNRDALQYSYDDVSALFPDPPACDGTASFSGGQYHPQAGKDGSRVTFIGGDMDFAPGVYCVMNNNVGPYHGAITGTGVTFYIPSPNFTITFNGSGNSFNASAPTSGDYAGTLIYLAPTLDADGNLLPSNQAFDLRGNGDQDTIGTILAPSATVTLFGNSNADATQNRIINSQIIAYTVDSGGNSNILLQYSATDNLISALPFSLTMLK